MMSLMTQSREERADQILGGKPDHNVLPAHVFTGVTNEMAIAKNETFGPIAPIIKVNGDEEALRVSNDTEYGLRAACVRVTKAAGCGSRWGLRQE
jgi:aldehyde dehydrogenase (NAD+)